MAIFGFSLEIGFWSEIEPTGVLVTAASRRVAHVDLAAAQ
jgi:hypothetical protein